MGAVVLDSSILLGFIDPTDAHNEGAKLAIAVHGLRSRLADVHGGDALSRLAKQVVAGELDPYTAADKLIAVS